MTDSPTRSLALRSTKSACALAHRGTPEQALAVLDLLAPDVPREPNHYRHTDHAHAAACADIAIAHPELAAAALTRLLDLASHGVQSALRLTATDQALEFLQGPFGHDDRPSGESGPGEPADDKPAALRDRALRLADQLSLLR